MTLRFSSASNLRRYAEERIQRNGKTKEGTLDPEVVRLIYELDVHREELEIQNEELLRTHAQLLESTRRYADLYEFAPVGYLTIDEDGTVLSANLTAATLLGRERSKVLGTRLGLYVSLESKRALLKSIDSVLLTETNATCEVTLAKAEGPVFVQLDINRSVGFGDSSTSCRVTMTDISMLRMAQRLSDQKDARLRSLADALPVLICYLDCELRIQFSNPAASEWLGHPLAELQNRRLDELLGESSEEFSNYFSDALSGNRADFAIRLGQGNQRERLLRITLVPDQSDDGTVIGIHALAIDKTEQSRIEKQDARRRRFEDKLVKLTASEKEVYELLIRGKSNKAIAFELDLSLRTAERRRNAILNKVGVDSLSGLLQILGDIQGIGNS